MNKFTFEIISDINKINPLKDEWDMLSNIFNSPMLNYDWFMTFSESNRHINLHIIAARHDGELVAIAPLAITKIGITHFYKIIGIRELYEPSSILYKDSDSLAALLEYVANLKYSTVLERISSSSKLAAFEFRNIGCISYIRNSACSYFLKTDATFENISKKMRKSRLQDINRKRRKLASLGETNFRAIDVTKSNFDEYFSIAVDIEARGWKGAESSAMSENQLLYNFFRSYCHKMASLNKLIIFLLYVDNNPIAMHIAINHADRLWILKLGHDSEYSKFSPGILLASYTIEYACKGSYSQYEFLGSGEHWQETWPVQTHEYVTIFIFPVRFSGFMGILQILYDKITGYLSR